MRNKTRTGNDQTPEVVPNKLNKDNIDEMTLTLLLMKPRLIERACSEIDTSFFQNSQSRAAFNLLIRLFEEQGAKFTSSQVLNRCEDTATKAFLSKLSFFELDDGELEKAFEDCLRAMLKRSIKQRMVQLQRDIKRAESLGEDTVDLVREYQDLLAQAK